jgi:threonine dehydratase
MNFDRMRFVSERARIGDGKEMLLLVQIPEKVGTFVELYMKLQPRQIVEFGNVYLGKLTN